MAPIQKKVHINVGHPAVSTISKTDTEEMITPERHDGLHFVLFQVDLGEGYGNFKCGPDDELVRRRTC